MDAKAGWLFFLLVLAPPAPLCPSCSPLPLGGGLEEVSPLSFQHLKQPLQLSTKGAHKKYLSLTSHACVLDLFP